MARSSLLLCVLNDIRSFLGSVGRRFARSVRTANVTSRRAGFSMLELLLFLSIFSIFSVTLVTVFISTQDARIRQQGIAAIEQRGGQLLQILTRRVRRSETILWPIAGDDGNILALQMSNNEEFPTLFTQSGSNLLLVEKEAKSLVLNDRITLSNFSVQNIANTSAIISFDLSIVLQLPTPTTYRRHFEAAVTLYPQDQPLAGGCGSCPAPECSAGLFHWHTCVNGSCTPSSDEFDC